jgi:signal transduction histidine kinase
MTALHRQLPWLPRTLLLAALCGLPWLPAAALAQETVAASRDDAVRTHRPGEPAQVLVITGSDPYLPAFVAIDAAMRGALVRRHQRSVVWLYESIDGLRLGGTTGPALAELIARKYEGVQIDAVVLVAEPAVEFYLQYRSRLWPEVGAIYDSVSPDFARNLPPDAGLSGIPALADTDGTLRIALALQPQARRILVVGGVSQFDEIQLRFARATLEPYRQRLEVEFIAGPSPQEVAARLAREDAKTIVLYTSLFRDAAGQVYVPRDVVSTLSAASGAPIYGGFETYLGHGLLAGAMESFADHGQRVGDLVALALDGRLAGAPVVQPPVPSNCLVDGRQLVRFGLSARGLPAGCEIRFVEVPFLQRYAWQTAAVVLALLAQSALIAGLLLQRRRRRAAEQSLQAQRAQLLHASRLAVAGELTAAIAHEINQPLTAILGNAEAGEMLAETGRLSKEELLQILGDIRRDDLRASEVIRRLRSLLAGHEGERRLFKLDDTVSETATLLRAEARRRDVRLELSLQAQRSDLLGDPVQIQQVIINLCLNAFDASDAQPEDRRRLLLETSDTPAGVQLSVRDFGTGIEPTDLSRVFDSFFTTKRSGMGLGLAIARSIVEAHGGTIAAVAHDIGAEFRLVLPTAPATVQPTPPATNAP